MGKLKSQEDTYPPEYACGKPKDLLEYVIVHEMVHLIEPTHSERFLTILGKHYPTWREASAGLNELPLAAESWDE